MIRKIAVAMGLLVFSLCLAMGGLQADNSFTTTVQRALTAMAVTLVIGLVIGTMAKKMIDENLKSEEEKLKKSSPSAPPSDR